MNEWERKLSKKFKGAYSSYEGSPVSKGILQFDMWNVKPDSGMYDWDKLKLNIKENGVRNSLLIALMPTASTSQIMGNNEAFEAITSNLYKRKTLAGEFILINKYLVEDLIKLDLWNTDIREKIMINDGSVQNIEEIPDNIKALVNLAHSSFLTPFDNRRFNRIGTLQEKDSIVNGLNNYITTITT